MKTALLGGASGIGASIVQAAVGKTEEVLFLPEWEDSNIAPRLIDRLARRLGKRTSLEEEWALGTAFHLGYGAFWGMVFSAARERYRVRPLTGGLLLGGFIYLITFPRWGGAVQTGTERPPERRTGRMEVTALSVTFGFGVATALLYEALRRLVRADAAPDAADERV